MKAELIARLEELLKAEDIQSIKTDVRNLIGDYNAETAKERHVQQEEFNAVEHEEGVDFQFSPNPIDEQFEQLLENYRERAREHGKKIAEEQKENLAIKTALLEELDKLIKEEENIKTAFDRFNLISEKWKATGDVPGDKFKDIQDQFTHQKDTFFYNVKIYKELREHDLKINHKRKEELIEKTRALLGMDSIREMDNLVRAYQREWNDIGPSSRESYKELGDTFFSVCREIIEKVRAHYDEIKGELEANLERKRALVEKMKQMLSLEIKNHSTWNKKTDEVVALQKEWKDSGFAPKKENEEIWQEFRGLCDLFFKSKGEYYESRRSEQDGSKEKKEVLIARARELQNSEDWKATTDEILTLQKRWKDCGASSPRDEQKLWQQFRAACDHFFQAKKKHYEGLGDRHEENLKLKLSVLEELEAFTLSGEKGKDILALKDFSARFSAIGHIPKEKMKEVMDRYHKALDKHYGSIDISEEERRMMNFREKVESAKDHGGSDNFIRKESNFLREKIDKLKTTVLQYQNNMEIFTGKGADALKKEIEKKIKQAEREIEDARKKLTLLRDQAKK